LVISVNIGDFEVAFGHLWIVLQELRAFCWNIIRIY